MGAFNNAKGIIFGYNYRIPPEVVVPDGDPTDDGFVPSTEEPTAAEIQEDMDNQNTDWNTPDPVVAPDIDPIDEPVSDIPDAEDPLDLPDPVYTEVTDDQRVEGEQDDGTILDLVDDIVDDVTDGLGGIIGGLFP